MCCKYRQTVWKNSCKVSNDCVNDEKWTISETNRTALDQFQKESRGIECSSVAVRSYPLLTCTPACRRTPPLLRILLCLCTETYSKFKEFVQEQIEKLSEEELAATKMTLLSETNHDEGLVKHDGLKNEVDILTL